jgi:hypothetical protein
MCATDANKKILFFFEGTGTRLCTSSIKIEEEYKQVALAG